MSENSESEVEVDPYEEIVGPNLNYSTPVASRTSSPLSRNKNEISKTHFIGTIVKCSESEVVSASTGLVASVTWPDLRYPCSLAGKNSSAMVAQNLDGNRLRATVASAFQLFSRAPQHGPRHLPCLPINEHHVTKLLPQKAISGLNFRHLRSSFATAV